MNLTDAYVKGCMTHAITRDLHPDSFTFCLVILTLIIWAFAIYNMFKDKDMEISFGLIGTIWLISLLRSSVNTLNDLYMLGFIENGISPVYNHLRFAFSLCNPIFQGAVLSLLFMIIAVLAKKKIKILTIECIWGIIAGLAAVLIGFFALMALTCDDTHFTVLSYPYPQPHLYLLHFLF